MPFFAMIKFFYIKAGDSQIVHMNQIQVTALYFVSLAELGK